MFILWRPGLFNYEIGAIRNARIAPQPTVRKTYGLPQGDGFAGI